MRGKVGWFVGLLLGLMVGCGTAVSPTPIRPTPIQPLATAVNALPPTAVPPADPALTATPAPTPIPDTGWQTLQPGLEQRTLHLFDETGAARERLVMLRLEPTQFTFRVAYRPGAPQSIPQWQAETDALLVVNGGFFTPENVATGLIITEGVANGSSYGDFAGMLAIDDGGPHLRWLRERPYTPDEPLLYALQSFPMLVQPGGALGFPEEDGVKARRTVIAQDRNGRVLFIFAPWGSLTLHELSRFLVQSDLDLDIAFNLDGGPSTGMLLAAETAVEIPAFTLLPAVITVHPR
ncbi:MAG: phosphodiester glycosidase family protein [Ardenticatenaceae bacterium]|nr:phosphodiester glycosidase family protein [Ardenticatenaceae bacterium]MCB8988138.1 phosphodiester glycosidase family protein [Ardenticatenaceae bacterium]